MASPLFSSPNGFKSRLTNGHAGPLPMLQDEDPPNTVQAEVHSFQRENPLDPQRILEKRMIWGQHSGADPAAVSTHVPASSDTPSGESGAVEPGTEPPAPRTNERLTGSPGYDLQGPPKDPTQTLSPVAEHPEESPAADTDAVDEGGVDSHDLFRERDGAGGGGGSRLKNRLGRHGGVSARYMPPLAESHLGAEEGTESIRAAGGGGVSQSNTSSYSATYSTIAASSAAGDRVSGKEGRAAPRKDALTVEGTWKVETVLKAKQGRKTSKGRKLAVAKWMAMIGLCLTILAGLVSVKLAVLILSDQLWEHLPEEGGEEQGTEWSQYTAQYILLYLYLSIPPMLMWLRSVWYGFLNKLVPWPPRKAVLLTVLSAGAESLGLCLMCYSVLGRYEMPVSLLLLAMVTLVPALNVFPLVLAQRRRGRVRAVTVPLVVTGVVLLFLGMVGVGVLIKETAPLNSDLWHPAVAVVCLSVAWLPSLQRYISSAARPKKPKSKRALVSPSSYGALSDDGGSYGNDSEATTTFDSVGSIASASNNTTTSGGNNANSNTSATPKTKSGDLSTNAAWKTAFIQNGCRVLFTFIFTCVLYMVDSGRAPSNVLTDEVHQAFLNAWDLSLYVQNSASWVAFWLGLGASLLTYVLAFAVCHMNMAKGALAPPLLLAMPLTLVLVAVTPACEALLPSSTCDLEEDTVKYLVPTGVCLALGHVLVFGWYLFRTDPVLLLQECMVFYVPGYNGVNLDAWLTLNRRQEVSVAETVGKKKRRKPKVFICTTMYREEEDEMRQLLESIRLINEARVEGDRSFESHIIFDNGVRQKELSEFALTLISLLEDTLGIEPQACTKVVTPYGLKLSWSLPGPRGQRMDFNIHLKDNLLVKNKKRWSQVMYMSYVLDFLTADDDEAFILTTDADVVFTPDSVEALLDLMTRDNSIGAVCARTHPMGGGPLVWYQVFEYAIGHWFQKTAEHALGSVLCAPGCFSVYRCRALADVLPKYAKKVETAFDFLTKDMGEDRWLCTLLVQSGWRIEYCAASENRTNCPDNFDEFYKQRRRWIASTLANLMLIVKEWKYVLLLNHRVSVIFLVYQGLLLFSTLIGPSTVMLVVSGGLSYAWLVDSVATVVVQVLACVIFILVCVYTTPKTQLMVAKLYTFLYAVVMTAVVVGTAAQIVDDLGKPTPGGQSPTAPPNGTLVTTTLPPNQHISVDLPMSVTTLYFLGLVAIFLMAGLLHPREFYCLVHGVWYMLCLPSGYLVLTIYSICNITDSSWGTREQAVAKSAVKKVPWQERVKELFYEVFFCFNKAKQGPSRSTAEAEVQTVRGRASSLSLSIAEEPGTPSSLPYEDPMGALSANDPEAPKEAMDEIPDETEPVPVEEWLPVEMRGRYVQLFKKHGFDSTLFIAGMTETELRRIGVTLKGHLRYLLDQIALIPAFEIEYKVPTNAYEWLEEIGLPMYRDNFKRNHIRQPKEMEILKSMGRKEIENELRIVKDGHIKRLKYAISMLRDPTEAQQRAIRMRQVIDEAPVHNLGEINIEENDFWESLRQKCLEPDLKAFGLEGEVKAKLSDLRNEWLMVLAVSNILWLILITTLASSASLTLLGANPLGLVFLTVFGFLFVLQFLTMLVHRAYTLSHFLARAPYRCGRPMQSSWTFSKSHAITDTIEDTVDYTAIQQVRADAQRAWDRVIRPKRKVRRSRVKAEAENPPVETTPLVG